MPKEKTLSGFAANRGARLLVEKGVPARAINHDGGNAIILKDGTLIKTILDFNALYRSVVGNKPTKDEIEKAALWAR